MWHCTAIRNGPAWPCAKRATSRAASAARQVVQQLRQRALDLPFKQVGELIELTGKDCDFNQRPDDDLVRREVKIVSFDFGCHGWVVLGS